MTRYAFPSTRTEAEAEPDTVYLVANGDLRLSANVQCWPVQQQLEADVTRAVERLGWSVRRAHEIDPIKGHGFIDSQRRGIEVFKTIPPDSPLLVVEAVWQYSHHVLAGLKTHRGPIMVLANWSGTFPGLVGLLNLTGSLTKAGVAYSSLWSLDFTDDFAVDGLRTFLDTGKLEHDLGHVRPLPALAESADEVRLGRALATQLKADKAIAGVFDEGCMGMYNAIFDDELVNPLGIYKERLSQSALVAEMARVPDGEADAAFNWLTDAGLRFEFGTDEASELTRSQVQSQLKMYIAALRIADDFGLDAVGIQYQQGLKDTVPASDLAEGLLNNVERPPVRSRDGSRELYPGAPLPHFNEVDEGVAVDALATNRIWTAMGLDPATTLHDVRWGEDYAGEFVWTFMISGSVPASHNGGYGASYSRRQPPMFFPLGGGTLSGCSKPGEIVWSRVYIAGGALHVDVGRGHVADLPPEETERRLGLCNPEWPIMNAVLHGVSRDQLMAQHKANHAQVAYAPDADTADRAVTAKAAFFDELGVTVHVCGDVALVGTGARMTALSGPSGQLAGIATLSSANTRSISPENFDGAKGGGGRAVAGTGAKAAADLGPGWKVSPSIAIDAGATVDLAAIDGPAVITHIWLTTHRSNWRRLVLRAYWDGADEPAIEVPVGDFFGQGWCSFAQLSSAVIAANPHGGFNSYFPMPFAGSARITLENLAPTEVVAYYQITYETDVSVEGTGYLHAQFRRSNPLPAKSVHPILDTVTGHGRYVGTYLAWGVNRSGWWGEGEIKFFLDGDDEFPTICGTGTEDYFGGAWNFDVPGTGYTAFTTPYLGLHQVIKPDGLYNSQQRFGMYRWHLADPIHFHSDLRVNIQALGWKSGWRYQPLSDDIASTAYFYLDAPTTNRPVFPGADDLEVFGAPMDPVT